MAYPLALHDALPILKCVDFSAEGMCKCLGSMEAEKIHTEGTFKCIGNIKTKSLYAEGIFKAEKEVSADVIKLEGMITCEELSADKIEIEGGCKVQKVFGESIKINNVSNGRVNFNLFFKPKDLSKAQLIECTELEADILAADVIRASRVKLGRYCSANLIEYSESIDIHPEAKIKEIVKI